MDAVLVDAVRTPLGARRGLLSKWHSVDLLAEVLWALCERTGVDPQVVDHVYAGCATPIGEQALNIARNAVFAAGWPEEVAATTLDSQVISGQSALHAAAAAVSVGMYDVCVVAGVESASRVPAGASTGTGIGKPFGPAVHERFAEMGGLVPPGVVAERMALRYEFDRAALDAWAMTSQERAAIASSAGAFKSEIHALEGVEVDELDHTLDVASLKPAFVPDGLITAATVARPVDGAAAMLLMREETAKALALEPLARVAAGFAIGTDVIEGDSGMAVAQRALDLAELSFGEVDQWEVHEDSAATMLAFLADGGVDEALVNPLGGALSLGDPGGASGIRMISTLVHALHRDGGRWGAAVTAGSGGLSAATLLETW